jgi:hypothetical protein
MTRRRRSGSSLMVMVTTRMATKLTNQLAAAERGHA